MRSVILFILLALSLSAGARQSFPLHQSENWIQTVGTDTFYFFGNITKGSHCVGDTITMRCDPDTMAFYGIDSVHFRFVSSTRFTLVSTSNFEARFTWADTSGFSFIRFQPEIWFHDSTEVIDIHSDTSSYGLYTHYLTYSGALFHYWSEFHCCGPSGMQAHMLSLSAGSRSLCRAAATMLTADGPYTSYRWSTGDSTRTITVHQPGTYTCTASTGCYADTAAIAIATSCTCGDSLHIVAAPMQYMCARDTLAGSVVRVEATMPVVWSTGDTTLSTLAHRTGWYYCTGYTGCGVFRDSTFVRMIAPYRSAPLDTYSICGSAAIQLYMPILIDTTFQIDYTVRSYSWSERGGNDVTTTVTHAGTYYCTITDLCNVRIIDTFIVHENCPPVALFTNTTTDVCIGGCVQYTDASTYHPQSWRWEFPGGTPATWSGQRPPEVCYAQPGTYAVRLVVSSAYGADSLVRSGAVTVHPPPVLHAIDTAVVVAFGSDVTLEARASAATYSWSPAVPGCGDACASVTLHPYDPLERYRCIATTAAGCADTSYYTIRTTGIYNTVYIPNAFSPNGDGTNDFFQIYTNRPNEKYVSAHIYDRWGEQVYASDDIHFAWDGTSRGAPLEGVYVYTITLAWLDGGIEQWKGSITILR